MPRMRMGRSCRTTTSSRRGFPCSTPCGRELPLGYGLQVAQNGYIRADLIHRDWHDFYAASVTTATRHTNTPLGIPVDLLLLTNSNNVERRYRGLQLQGRWTPAPFDL